MPTSSFNQYFPGYEILGELGRGNARVLKARNQITGELVAIKHFSFNTDAATLRRFQQESEIMTTLKNYNIVKIKEVHLDSDMPYVAMEFIEGGDLRSLLKERGHLDVATTIRLGLQMTEAFKAIHQAGIIHRDIKPENIMYRFLHSGELHFLLTDFGIARLREQSVTVTGQSLMTYEYASPEQFDNPKGVTVATDYYSLGVVLYECLSGKLPFELQEGRVHTFINKVMSTSPPALALPAESQFPESLKTLVNGLLAKNADERIKDELTVKRKLKRAEIEEIEGYPEEISIAPSSTLGAGTFSQQTSKDPAFITTANQVSKGADSLISGSKENGRIQKKFPWGNLLLIMFILAGGIFAIYYFSKKSSEQNGSPKESSVSSVDPLQTTRNHTINPVDTAVSSIEEPRDTVDSVNQEGVKDEGIVAPPVSDTAKGVIEAPEKEEEIFSKVEVEPSYPGGPSAWMRYLNRTFTYPQEAQDNEIQGTVVVQFIVDKEGNVSDVKAVSGPTGGGLRDEAIRVIKKSGNWEPALQNGRKVRSYKKQPITFQLGSEE